MTTTSANNSAETNKSEGIKSFRETLISHSWGKMAFLGGLSVALSTFTPFSIFSPAPLAIAFLLFGPLRTSMMVLIFLGIIAALVFKTGLSVATGGIFVGAFIYAGMIFMIIRNKMTPSNGIMKFGLGLMALLLILLFTVGWSAQETIKGQLLGLVNAGMAEIKNNSEFGQLVAKGGDEIRSLQDMMKDPESVVKELLQWAPSAIFITVFLTLWTSLFVVLRNAFVWRSLRAYPYETKDLLNFKTPDFLVFPLITCLGMVALSDYLGGEAVEVWGMNGLYALGIFYFFQGVGVFFEFLDSIKIFGIFRTLIVVFTLFSGWKFIALLGLFDHWVNFRKFFKKNNKEGDLI